MASKLPIWDQRMFELIEITIADPGNKIKSEEEFLQLIGINAKSTGTQVKAGKQSFRIKHIQAACKIFGRSADWFLGLTDRTHRLDVQLNPLQQLKQAVRLVEQELSPGKKLTKKLTKRRKTG